MSLQEDPLSSYLDHEVSGYDTQAYPSYFDTNDRFEPKFTSLIEYEHEIISLKRFDDVGCSAISDIEVVNVDDFGAKGDGTEDDTEAFEKAWEKACSSTSATTLVVPSYKNYLLKPVRFSGPCESDLTIKIYGTIEASDDRSDYELDFQHWLVFENIENFLVEGGGTINGNGDIWWENSCKINKSLPCTHAPTAITFNKCKNLRVANLKIKDAQQIHLSFQKCVDVQASNLMVTAPEKSPNTDGIHVTKTQNIQIESCVIGTGDDCISIVSGSENVQVIDITCGPGHGISIGSLGSGNSEAHVSNVMVNRAVLSGTTNGVRIKTWQGSAVQVRDVVYKNIIGTSASEVAIKFNCSKSFPCLGIALDDIDLVSEGEGTSKASCENVEWSEVGKVIVEYDAETIYSLYLSDINVLLKQLDSF
ncbi:hypothetical protein HHK36_011909 [Tetracentron sinense]|uniref:Polygalacturonase n=1 Tax=Tetracentron sinense TaxID=13715 RepID=A0A835DGR1_TETSI|nr:hypothetical protein HHK36_011909 [Tetracentron sinense]